MRFPVLALSLVLTAIPLAAAADSSEGPRQPVESTLARARAVVVGGGPRSEQLDALRDIARGLLDTRAMGRRALGKTLADQPAEKREAFQELFEEFMLRSYLRRLLFFRAPRFSYGPVSQNGDTALVETKILTGKDAFLVEYEMARLDGRWRATDIRVEGISLSENYADQFASLLRDRSFDELLTLMRRKLRLLEERDAS